MPVFAELLHGADDKVRMEAPEFFRIPGKRRREFVRSYIKQLRQISETDENRAVRTHCLGAVQAAESKKRKGIMKDFTRNNPYFSLCGLNCKLCPMHISGHCGGCGFGNQSCPIARCSLEHGKPEYCFQCPEYPCERYAHIDEYDSFITHRNQKADLEKMQRIGEEAYNAEQAEKRQILDRLLAEYNDGRKKTLFCLAVNLMPAEELRTVFEDGDPDLPLKERARQMEKRLKEKSGAELKLRRKK